MGSVAKAKCALSLHACTARALQPLVYGKCPHYREAVVSFEDLAVVDAPTAELDMLSRFCDVRSALLPVLCRSGLVSVVGCLRNSQRAPARVMLCCETLCLSVLHAAGAEYGPAVARGVVQDSPPQGFI